jgi:glycosyltransferase involved in cell wall biosynthesis
MEVIDQEAGQDPLGIDQLDISVRVRGEVGIDSGVGAHGLIRRLRRRRGELGRIMPAWRHRFPGRPRQGTADHEDRLPRHILLLSWRCPRHPLAGGAEVMLLEHARRWVCQGHRVTLLCPRFPGAVRTEDIDGMNVIRIGGRFTVYPLAAIFYLLRLRSSVDTIVDVENGIPFFSPLYARKPIVCLLHHVHQRQFLVEFGPALGWIGRFLEAKIMPRVYAHVPFIVVSGSTAADLAALGVDAEHIRVVHNGLDHAAYGSPGTISERPRLLYLGRLKRHKRIDLAIELCARLRMHVPELVLDIVGAGDDEARLRALVHRLGLQEHVVFHGFVGHSEKVHHYSRAWALVCTSEREGWGLTTIEAAACGTPTLCLDAPGLRDAVQSGTTGFVARDMDDLCAAALRLITDDTWRTHLARGAEARARTFTWTASAEAGRDAVIDARLEHRGALARRPLGTTRTVTMMYRLDTVPIPAWSLVAEAVARETRGHDSVTILNDGISVNATVGSDDDVDAVGKRVQSTIDRFSSPNWTAVDTTIHVEDDNAANRLATTNRRFSHSSR